MLEQGDAADQRLPMALVDCAPCPKCALLQEASEERCHECGAELPRSPDVLALPPIPPQLRVRYHPKRFDAEGGYRDGASRPVDTVEVLRAPVALRRRLLSATVSTMLLGLPGLAALLFPLLEPDMPRLDSALFAALGLLMLSVGYWVLAQSVDGLRSRLRIDERGVHAPGLTLLPSFLDGGVSVAHSPEAVLRRHEQAASKRYGTPTSYFLSLVHQKGVGIWETQDEAEATFVHALARAVLDGEGLGPARAGTAKVRVAVETPAEEEDASAPVEGHATASADR